MTEEQSDGECHATRLFRLRTLKLVWDVEWDRDETEEVFAERMCSALSGDLGFYTNGFWAQEHPEPVLTDETLGTLSEKYGPPLKKRRVYDHTTYSWQRVREAIILLDYGSHRFIRAVVPPSQLQRGRRVTRPARRWTLSKLHEAVPTTATFADFVIDFGNPKSREITDGKRTWSWHAEGLVIAVVDLESHRVVASWHDDHATEPAKTKVENLNPSLH